MARLDVIEDAILALAHMCWGRPCDSPVQSEGEANLVGRMGRLADVISDAKKTQQRVGKRGTDDWEYKEASKQWRAASEERTALIPAAQKMADNSYVRSGGKTVELADPPNAEQWAAADKKEPATPDLGMSNPTRNAYVMKDVQTTKKNAATRAKGKMDAWSKKIDTELTTQHTTEPRVFHRAAALSPTLLNALSVGTSYVDPAPVSSDIDPANATFYGGARERDNPGTRSVHMVLRAPTGTRLANVGYGEHVIAPGTRYTVVGHQVQDGKHVVTMELSRDA